MKKIFSVVMVCLLCLSMFSMFAPKAKADSAYLTDIVQLTTNPYDDRGAGWFPDSSKMVYSAFADSWYRHIWIMNSDGSNKQQLTFGSVVDEAPDYSPDGTKIVFMRYGLREIDGSDLMMMNADGTNIQQLTSTGLHRGQPRWSNDGLRLAFYYGGAGTTTNEIHIMNADGTNEVTVASGTYPVMNPYWSPDDTKLVYTMDDGIWIVNTSPPYQKTRLFQTSLPTMYAVFSPDGKYIMYASGVYGQLQHQDLYLIDIYGNFIAQLTYDTTFGYAFDWSPDGQYIAYNSMSSGNYDVWRAKIVGASSTGAMVGYWKFDEGTGSVASDSSGNGNTGTLNNGPQWVDGKVGKALKFDGVDDYVYVPHSSSLDITGNQMTVEYWMKLAVDWHPGMTTNYNIYDKGDAYVGSMIGTTGAHRFNLPYKPQYPETNKNSWTADVWYHIADVYDGAYIKLYVNGVLDKSEPVTGPISHSTYNLAIGAQCIQAWPWYFNGTIDEFAIYNYARTAEEIANDYSSLVVSLPWKDDFNYQTLEQMEAAGWTILNKAYTSLEPSCVILDNDGSIGTRLTYNSFQTGIYNWTVEVKGMWIGRSTGSIHVAVGTQNHEYEWWGDGYYPEFVFTRDGIKIYRFGGFQPVLNEWFNFTMQRKGNVFYMFCNGVLETTYTELDETQSQVTGVWINSAWIGTTKYDYVALSARANADFTWKPSMPRATKPATFNASDSTPNGGTIAEYTWDFGDGNITSTTDPIIVHKYSAPNRYNVTLTVTDSQGLTDSVTKEVKITHRADVNCDGQVDVRDYYIVSRAFGEDPTRPRWNPLADINEDEKVDIKDLYIVAKAFGWLDP